MKVNEIFYSLQGEGFWTGTAAVFVRLSGCNLRCPFCDTAHETGRQMSEDEIVAEVVQYPARHIVITGGEPSLWLTTSLVEKLHAAQRFVAVETNGTRPLPANVDWITLSPKDAFVDKAEPQLSRCDELKVVMDERLDILLYADIDAQHRFVQPCDTGNAALNQRIVEACIGFCKAHPTWRLSLQTHKLIDIP